MSNHRSIETIRNNLRRGLGEAGMDSPGLEASLLIEHVTGMSRAEQIQGSETKLGKRDWAAIEALLLRRISGEPIDNILGVKAFYGLDFRVTPEVLSPRPETELLIDFVLDNSSPDAKLTVLDVGTGSGAIPIAVLKNRPFFKGVAVDVSDAALLIAGENARVHKVNQRLNLVSGHWFEPIIGSFDFILSNPPYIASERMSRLSPEVQNFDPVLALDGGDNGLEAYHAIAESASEFLKPDGYLVLEIGFDQGKSVPRLLKNSGFADIRLHQDLSGLDRMVTARLMV